MSTGVETRLESLLVELDASGYRVHGVVELDEVLGDGDVWTHSRVEVTASGEDASAADDLRHVTVLVRGGYLVTGVTERGYTSDARDAVERLRSAPSGLLSASNEEYALLRAARLRAPGEAVTLAHDTASAEGWFDLADLLHESDYEATRASVRAVTRLLDDLASGTPAEWAVRHAWTGDPS